MNFPAQPCRLPSDGLIDRSRTLAFRFDGSDYTGYAGDTLASALLAAGTKLIGRSFKYHRRRGILTCGSEEPNALVELRRGARREANTRATVIELFDGLEASSQNCWPSLSFDLGAINSLCSPLLAAGFYYKTFMWPPAWWEKVYEPAIRRAAGLGRVSVEADPDSYDRMHGFCDVLVIGGGPAGLACALAAGRCGARVILCDEDFVLGGRLNADRRELDGMTGREWALRAELELASMPQVQVLRRTTVFGAFDGGLSGARVFGAVERVSDHLPEPLPHQPRHRYWKIVAKRAVLAAGAIERGIVFGGNDLPGVMMSAAVRAYLNRFAVAPCRSAAVFTTTDDGWSTAFDLARSGARVEAIVDARSVVSPTLLKAAAARDLRVLRGARVVEAHGFLALTGATVREASGDLVRLPVDLLAISGGWNPNLALTTHLGGKPQWSDALSSFVPGAVPQGMRVVGAAHGSLTLAEALEEGIGAGVASAEAAGRTPLSQRIPKADDELCRITPLWWVPESRSKAFVDYQHDVTHEDIALALREGFASAEHLKRYTTLGMGTDQGKTSSVNGQAIMAALAGRGIAEVGTTVYRPPFTPVAIGAFAGPHRGKHFKPTRRTSGHRWAQERGALFLEAGQWLRAQWFPRPEETSWLQTVAREVRSVRSTVGVCDVSTLGKIDIQGPDAGAFLDRIYINTFSTLPVGKVRYGLMLREDGFVLDDGTTARLGTEQYLVSTTTANALRVMQHLEHARQILWPELDVQIISVTEQWAQYAIAGPQARALLRRLLGDAIDLSNEAFPYLACAEFEWRGVSCRLFRISFSGELAYELAVPAQYGDALIRAIEAVGAEFGLVPYGTEALGVMRIEKGHIAGNEINGTTTPADLGLGRMMSGKKDFIGRVLSMRPALRAATRPALVGVRPVRHDSRLYAGAHFLSSETRPSLANDLGYLTSVAYSPMLNHWIGLGLLSGGLTRLGERVRAYDPLHGQDVEVEVVSPHFFDPDGLRLEAGVNRA